MLPRRQCAGRRVAAIAKALTFLARRQELGDVALGQAFMW
jgi:hypothetical protein